MIERRYNPTAVENRADGNNRISGLAAVFYDGSPDTEWSIMRNAVERIMPHAFDFVLQQAQDVRALFNHSLDIVLGRCSANTLTLTTTDRGLLYEIEPSESSIYKDLAVSIRRGDVTGSSFGFQVAPNGERWTHENGRDIREIHSIGVLTDVGPVTFPAYAGATAGVRSDGDISEIDLESYRKYRRGIFAKLARVRLIELGLT